MESKKEDFLISIFETLKEEQLKRIEFRDHMVYITLVAIGGVFSFALEKTEFTSALLVLPFIVTVLGWMYVSNDVKITKIGSYCSQIILPKFEGKVKSDFSLFPTWEEYYRKSSKRKERKYSQLVIDLSVFCFSSMFSIGAYHYITKEFTVPTTILSIVELMVIIYLGVQIYSYSIFKKKGTEIEAKKNE